MNRLMRISIATTSGHDGELFIAPWAVSAIEDRAPGRCTVVVDGVNFVVPMTASDFAAACQLAEEANAVS